MTDRLNFSFHNNNDHMMFLKSACNQSPEEVFLGVTSSKLNEKWMNEGHDHQSSSRPENECLADEQVNISFPTRDSEVTFTKQLVAEGNDKQRATLVREITTRPRSILNGNGSLLKNTSKTSAKVSFCSPADRSSVIQRDSEKKLLGYDWIAALLDNTIDEKVIEESEDFFENLKNFRRINRDECSSQVHIEARFSLEESKEPSSVGKETEKRVKAFMVNDRLFTVPLRADLQGTDDHVDLKMKTPTYEEPRFIRVSVPQSTFESTYRFKAHRRNSFDPTNSCGLREHCVLGCENSRPAMIPAATNIGLRDATDSVPYTATTLANAEQIARAHEWSFPSGTTSTTTRLPEPVLSRRRKYQDSMINMSSISATQPPSAASLPADTEVLQKATTDLLNSTYSMMYEMECLKLERALEGQNSFTPLPAGLGTATAP